MAAPQEIIGHYRIISKLGQGGMGEVWRATDTRLNREVAVKVLPAAFAEDPMRMGRFAREAQVLASLNHPGIAAIYGVEERALVMELVEGPTLAERIARGAVPLEEALSIAKQIAEALEYAHEKGVIHRDLKPANIKITPEGRVKVLDFGLAKAMSTDPTASALADAATLSSPATLAGTILGTAAYMSPEQARGHNVDRRADIWAFGVVFYEMLAGERPFGGPTISDTLAAVLKTEPELGKLPASVSPIIEACLRKDCKERWQWIGDVRLALAGHLPFEGAVNPAQRRTSLTPWLAAGVVALVAGLVLWSPWRGATTSAPGSAALAQFVIFPPPNATFSLGTAFGGPTVSVGGWPALSPDGRELIFEAHTGPGSSELWLRPLDATTAHPLAGTESASWPFWSPDGRFIGFVQNDSLMKVDVSGGPAIKLADAPNFAGASWSPSGVIVFSAALGPLLRVSDAGGAATPVGVVRAGESRQLWPWFLPDGRHFLFNTPGGAIHLGSLDTTDTRVIQSAGGRPMYAAGRLLFIRPGVLMEQPFDPRRLVTLGDAAPLPAVSNGGATVHPFSVSANGALVYTTAATPVYTLAWFNRDGQRLATVGDPGPLGELYLSPDGKRATVLVTRPAPASLWIYDLVRNVRSRLTFGQPVRDGVWSADGAQVIFASGSSRTQLDLYRRPANGAGNEELVYAGGGAKFPKSWSRDGKFVLYSSLSEGQGIYVLALDAPLSVRKPRLFVDGGDYGQFSPDGRWVAYQSAESGRTEVYLTSFPNPGGKFLVSTSGGALPRWRADGKELFYVAPDLRLMAAEINLQATAAAIGGVRPLFGPVIFASDYSYDVTPDGQRFLVEVGNADSVPSTLTWMLNWPAALKK